MFLTQKNDLFGTKGKNHLIFLPEGFIFHLPGRQGPGKRIPGEKYNNVPGLFPGRKRQC
jgi:hypothetical protein